MMITYLENKKDSLLNQQKELKWKYIEREIFQENWGTTTHILEDILGD